MRVSIGCRLRYSLPQPTPLIAMLNVHYSRFGDLERADYLVASPSVPLENYRDGFGNWCTRLMAPAGDFALSTDGIFRDYGRPDPAFPDAKQHAVHDLPFESLVFLQGSRYCDTDLLSEEAWRLARSRAAMPSRVWALSGASRSASIASPTAVVALLRRRCALLPACRPAIIVCRGGWWVLSSIRGAPFQVQNRLCNMCQNQRPVRVSFAQVVRDGWR